MTVITHATLDIDTWIAARSADACREQQRTAAFERTIRAIYRIRDESARYVLYAQFDKVFGDATNLQAQLDVCAAYECKARQKVEGQR